MFIRDRHLNVFEYYQDSNTLPIENNISRGFAIILNSYPLVLDRFIDYINTKCEKKSPDITVLKPEHTDHFDIGFQQSIKRIYDSYSELSSIVGITLTASLLEDGSAETSNTSDTSANLITDIAVAIGDTIIIIEVKRTNENALPQLEKQIQSLKESVNFRNKEHKIQTQLLDGTWEEIIDILQKSANLLMENDDRILTQYLQHLNLHYPQWFPIKKLSEIDFSEENASAIEKRIRIIAQHCCSQPDEAKHQWGGYSIPTCKSYAGYILIEPNYGDKALNVKIWVADTKSQGSQYFCDSRDPLSLVNIEEITIGGQSFKITVAPYIKFAHFQASVFNSCLTDAFCKKELGEDTSKWRELWSAISKRWKREDWSDLLILLTKTYDDVIDRDEIDQKFASEFEQSNRSYVDVSLGFEVTAKIPYSVITMREREGDFGERDTDSLALLAQSLIEEMLQLIE